MAEVGVELLRRGSMLEVFVEVLQRGSVCSLKWLKV
jgi:hypothetical protein